MSVAFRSLRLAQALSVMALSLILFTPRNPLSMRLRIPVALIAFVLSGVHLFSLIL